MSATATTTTTTTAVTTTTVLSGERETTVFSGGSGPALVWFTHEELSGWNALTDALAATHTVHVPVIAGTEEAINSMDGLHDLLIYVLDVFDALGLDTPVAVGGESFGAMVAAELAAIAPNRVSKLVLVAPLGLWDDHVQIPDLYAAAPEVLAARLFGDASSEPAQEWLAGLTDKVKWLSRLRSMRTALHFVFPIPEIGLHKRIHRISCPTLLVWGSNDGVVVPSYAQAFRSRIKGSTIATIDGGGHLLSAGRPAETAAAIAAFL